MKKILTLLTALVALHCSAQEIAGQVLNKNNQPVQGATVTILQGGVKRGATTTAADGSYVVKPLDAGFYDIQVTAREMAPYTETRIVVTADVRTTVNCTMPPATGMAAAPANDTVHLTLGNHMVNRTQADVNVIQRNDIYQMPYTNMNDVISTSPGVRQVRRGDAISIEGSQPGGVAYYEDGVRVLGR